MATVNEGIRDSIIQTRIDLQKYGNGVVKRVMAILNSADAELQIELVRRLSSGKFIWTQARITAVLNAISGITKQSYAEAMDMLDKEMGKLAVHDSEHTLGILQDSLPDGVSLQFVAPTAEQLVAIASTTPIAVGPESKLLLEEIFTNLAAGKENSIRQAVRMGMTEGQGISDIVRRLIGTKANKYADGIIQKDRSGAATMVRTIVNHTSNQAAQLTYTQNNDLIKGVRWTSTLDGRTSPVCRARDGKVFPVNAGPRPPAHPGCRSFMVPILKSWRDMGIPIDEMEPGTRASMDGQVPSDTTYQEWLKTRSPGEVKDILGPTRAKLFIEGNLPLDKFVSDQGQTLTLAQIKAKYPKIWKNQNS